MPLLATMEPADPEMGLAGPRLSSGDLRQQVSALKRQLREQRGH